MWIESHTDLREHPKVLRLCGRLSKPLPEIIGHLHLLWWWTAVYRLSGELTGLTDSEIASYSRWQGDAKVFVTALIKERWLDRKGGKTYIHDWSCYCGKLIKARLDRAGQKQELLRPKRELLRPEKGSTNKTQQTKQTAPTIPTIPTIPNKPIFLELRESLLKLGFTSRSVAGILSYDGAVVEKAIALSEGKRNRPGFITDALKKGWVK